jgi:hypothetical protein
MSGFKKFNLLFFAAFYLLLSFGFGIKIHYCHGNLSSISYVTSLSNCECSDESTIMPCCNDVEKLFQLDEKTRLPEIFHPEFNNFIAGNCPLIVDNIESIEIHGSNELEVIDRGPPKYIKFSSLIFYA